MKKYVLFSLFLSLACLVWQCKDEPKDEVKPDETAPTIASFTPTSGGIGAIVTITGTNFSTTASSNVVKFNGTTATVTSATATSIVTKVPTGTTTGKITVEVAGKTATSVNDFTFIRYATVSTFVGGSGVGSVDGTGTAAKFNNPTSIVKDAQGNLYLSDNSNATIRKITPQGVVTTFAGTAGQTGDTDGTGAAARFKSPAGMCLDASGNLYVSEATAARIRKITPQGVVTIFAGSATGLSGYTDATGTAARFSSISGITIDAQNNLYVYDRGNTRIRKITPAGVVTTLGIFIEGLTIYMSPNGTLYVSTKGGIAKVNTSTGLTTLWVGAEGETTGFVNGETTTARFSYIVAMDADSEGNLYVTDRENFRVRKITPAGVVSNFAGTGIETVTDAAIGFANFYRPLGISVSNNVIYVVDGGIACRVRKIE